MNMIEKREIIIRFANYMEYKVRSGQISYPIGDKIWRLAIDHPEMVDDMEYILDLELSEDETLKRIENLIWFFSGKGHKIALGIKKIISDVKLKKKLLRLCCGNTVFFVDKLHLTHVDNVIIRKKIQLNSW